MVNLPLFLRTKSGQNHYHFAPILMGISHYFVSFLPYFYLITLFIFPFYSSIILISYPLWSLYHSVITSPCDFVTLWLCDLSIFFIFLLTISCFMSLIFILKSPLVTHLISITKSLVILWLCDFVITIFSFLYITFWPPIWAWPCRLVVLNITTTP